MDNLEEILSTIDTIKLNNKQFYDEIQKIKKVKLSEQFKIFSEDGTAIPLDQLESIGNSIIDRYNKSNNNLQDHDYKLSFVVNDAIVNNWTDEDYIIDSNNDANSDTTEDSSDDDDNLVSKKSFDVWTLESKKSFIERKDETTNFLSNLGFIINNIEYTQNEHNSMEPKFTYRCTIGNYYVTISYSSVVYYNGGIEITQIKNIDTSEIIEPHISFSSLERIPKKIRAILNFLNSDQTLEEFITNHSIYKLVGLFRNKGWIVEELVPIFKPNTLVIDEYDTPILKININGLECLMFIEDKDEYLGLELRPTLEYLGSDKITNIDFGIVSRYRSPTRQTLKLCRYDEFIINELFEYRDEYDFEDLCKVITEYIKKINTKGTISKLTTNFNNYYKSNISKSNSVSNSDTIQYHMETSCARDADNFEFIINITYIGSYGFFSDFAYMVDSESNPFCIKVIIDYEFYEENLNISVRGKYLKLGSEMRNLLKSKIEVAIKEKPKEQSFSITSRNSPYSYLKGTVTPDMVCTLPKLDYKGSFDDSWNYVKRILDRFYKN